MTWRRGTLFILAVLAFALIRQRAPDMRPDGFGESAHRTPRTPQAEKPPERVPVATPPPPASYYTLLQEDRFCEVMKASLDKDDHRLQFLRSLGLLQEGPVYELAGEHSPYFTDPSAHVYTSASARFVQALQLALLIQPAQVKVPDYERSRKLLLDLEQEDPGNIAYPLFRLKVEQLLSLPEEEIHKTAARIVDGNRFDSHSMELYREVAARMEANASKYLAGIGFTSTLPTPEYQGFVQMIRELDDAVPGLREKVGILMIREGLNADKISHAGGYNAIEYSLGRALVPWLELPSFADLDRQRLNGRDPWDFSNVFKAFTDSGGHQKNCTEATKTDFYAALREMR